MFSAISDATLKVKTEEDHQKPYSHAHANPMSLLDIVPDVLDQLPSGPPINLTYVNTAVTPGEELTPTQVKDEPLLTYPVEQEGRYLVCMTDPDAPSRSEPRFREFLHWLVGNIPGTNVISGDILAEYVGAGPPKGTGLHRYVVLVYKQSGRVEFTEPRLTNMSTEGRRMFSIKRFAQKYNLGDPVAVNVFQAQWDDYVPQLHKQLGIKAR